MATHIDKGPPWWRSQRYILSYLLFAMMMNVFLQRINLSIAIICMVNHTALRVQQEEANQSSYQTFDWITQNYANSSLYNISIPLEDNDDESTHFHNSLLNGTEVLSWNKQRPTTKVNGIDNYPKQYLQTSTDTSRTSTDLLKESSVNKNISGVTHNGVDKCSNKYITAAEADEDGPFLWDKETQGLLLGALFWTYFVIQIPGNHLIRRFRKKSVTMISMSVMTVTTLLTHVAALQGPWLVFAIRLVQGGCTAFVFIAVYGIWVLWAPPKERATLISVSISGQMLGNVLAYPLSALLCKYGFLGGWPSVFYVFGIISCVVVMLYFFFAAESPREHPFITKEEKEYIESCLADQTSHTLPPVPWLAILTSPPFWGIICGHVSFTWGLHLLSFTLPQYMNEILKLDIKSNGLYTMLPFLIMVFTAQAGGRFSDLIIRKQWLRPVGSRRLCMIIAHLTPAVMLAVISFLDCTQSELAIALLTIGMSVKGFSFSGFLVSPYDIAPRFATVLMTISNSLASIPGFVAPYVVGAITKNQTREQWQIVFFLTSGIYVLGLVCFCVLASGDVQSWARDKPVVTIIGVEAAEEDEEEVGKEKTKEEMESKRGPQEVADDEEKEQMLSEC